MNQVKVDYGALDALRGDIDSRNRAIQNQLDNLGSQIKKLEGIWEGAGNEAFLAQKNTWFQSAEDLNQVLAKIAVAVQTSNDNYQGTDKGVESRFR